MTVTAYMAAVLAAARQELPMTVGVDMSWATAAYHLTGPVPCRADPDVAAFITAVADNRMDAKLENGLVMRIGGYGRLYYLTFYVTNDGTHRFYEMSSDDERMWRGSHPCHGPDETADAIRHIRTAHW